MYMYIQLDMLYYPNEYLKLFGKHGAFFWSSDLLNYFDETNYFILKKRTCSPHTSIVKSGSCVWLFNVCNLLPLPILQWKQLGEPRRRLTSSPVPPSLSLDSDVFQMYDFVPESVL